MKKKFAVNVFRIVTQEIEVEAEHVMALNAVRGANFCFN